MSSIALLDFSDAGLSGCEQFALCTSSTAESNSRRMVSSLFQDHPAPESKEPAHATAAMATLAFAVRRRDPELVGPAAPTPRETKRLSEIDDQDTLRGHVSFALVYRARVMDDDDVAPVHPAGVIRRALGEVLVHYYPLAGRLREAEGRKLVVDCSGEGVMFVEADADVRLEELEGAGLRPPFPCMDQLLFDVEGSGGVLNCPLLLIQVTRLLWGGFIFALRLNHTMCDTIGIVQFMNAVAELARGLPAPTVAPPWSRELLEARNPPMASFPHREFDLIPPPAPPAGDMVMRSFIFGPSDLAAIKKHLPPLVRDKVTTFEALAAYLWCARTAALEVPQGEEARLVIIANFRAFVELGLPGGYYGNACVPLAALADAAALRGGGSLADAVALVRRAKAAVTAEYVRSTVDVLVLRGRPFLALQNLFVVSDNRHAGFHRVDFGWGEPVYGGPADTVFGVTFLVPVKDRDGEDAITVPIVLPRPAMERFAAEMESLCKA
ncbi:benzyl alcohol O-benzoyltransferase-like [Triticum dicoccoides]|uniref:benzyl alcohol O-benzoyltransferase-like n=1 Tax=Triticum dicoccoides TaxID=85692 RepID=UPI00188EB4B0|nr:benzyl alcohol O-benzoyltransferase-like [Triticum dicoccoides]